MREKLQQQTVLLKDELVELRESQDALVNSLHDLLGVVESTHQTIKVIAETNHELMRGLNERLNRVEFIIGLQDNRKGKRGDLYECL